MQSGVEARAWAYEEFGGAELGDRRRRVRLILLAQQTAERPGGRLTEVCSPGRHLEGAYDFLENPHVRSEQLLSSMAQAAARRAAERGCAIVAIDGTSLTLTDRAASKDFGAIGDSVHNARGLKVINALAIDPVGVPLGLVGQTWWVRPKASGRKRKRAKLRAVAHKETQRWLDTITAASDVFRDHAPDVRVWFQIDREGDAAAMLLHLQQLPHDFTVRSSWNRRLVSRNGRKAFLRQQLSYTPVVACYTLDIAASAHRQARTAHLSVRAKRVTLLLTDPWTGTRRPMNVTAVWARETTTAPKGETPIDWLLLTSVAVQSDDDALRVLTAYTYRWRVEDFHKTWKSGRCNVEDTQLRSKDAVIKWATILAAVATRAERLKHLSREQPDVPASRELSPNEIRALLLITRKYKGTKETIPDSMPTLQQATLWIARLGGYMRQSDGRPPGSITISRGLQRLRYYAEMLDVLDS